MGQIVQFFTGALRESFGSPVKLLRLLTERPDIRVSIVAPRDDIACGSVVRWDELGKASAMDWPRREHGHLLGWKASGHYYGSFFLHRPEFAQLGRKTVVERWSCDIQQVHGFSASKSELTKFRSMDEMVECNSREMISEVSHQALARNLAHDEIRITRSGTDDFFQHHQWDGRLFLMNSGGSHHFAAAKYIAARLEEPVPLVGRLYSYALSTSAIISLRRDFDLFVISDEPAISESPRVLRRLHCLREWSYEEATQVFPRSHRARRAHGQRGQQRVRIAVGSNHVYRG